jgi:hypothetical protein
MDGAQPTIPSRPSGTPAGPLDGRPAAPVDVLADRYGRRPPSGRGRAAVIAVAVTLVVAALAWAGYGAWQSAHTPVRWTNTEFKALDDGLSRLRFSVTTDPGRRVVCSISIMNQGLTEVGRTDVTVGPSPDRTFIATAEVPTFELGTSGTVRTCAQLPN